MRKPKDYYQEETFMEAVKGIITNCANIVRRARRRVKAWTIIAKGGSIKCIERWKE